MRLSIGGLTLALTLAHGLTFSACERGASAASGMDRPASARTVARTDRTPGHEQCCGLGAGTRVAEGQLE